MKVLDAGTQLLDDRDVLGYIHDKHHQHATLSALTSANGRTPTSRPANFTHALRTHEQHITHADRPFAGNARYDGEARYLTAVMRRLEGRVQLTKTELLMVVNHRPHVREFLLPMIEDVEARLGEEEQQWIVDTVVDVLGKPGKVGVRDGDGDGEGDDKARKEGEVKEDGKSKGDVEMTG